MTSWGGDVSAEPLLPGSRLPLLVRPARGSPELAEWAALRRQALEQSLLEHGALLFRGFQVGESTFARFMEAASRSLLDYVYRSTPRTAMGQKVYTATEYPARMTIPLHNENAYQRDWPMKLGFHCVVAAQKGGETPLADMVRVTARLDPALIERFARHGIMYVRNYGAGVDLPWQTVFQTQDPAEVERFCREQDISWEWLPEGRLRTRQVCQAVASHPVTGQRFWFNQAHLFHFSSLDPDTREDLLYLLKEEGLPRNAYHGNGERIADEDLQAIRAAFEQEAVAFPWQPGDILLVDNMQAAHGRNPFQGPRKLLVMMSDPCSEVGPRSGGSTSR
jgi:alpha-ketoglutarate-dependent taurine dioxygenase